MYFFRDLKIAFALKYFHSCFYVSSSFVGVSSDFLSMFLKLSLFKFKSFGPL